MTQLKPVTTGGLLKDVNDNFNALSTVGSFAGLDYYEGIETVVPVPQSRFYTAVTLNAGATSDAGGFAKGATAKDLNFLIVHPSAVLQPVKLNQVKYFSPDVNQISDGHLWQYRLYHDAFVYDNRANGIYRHDKNS